MREIKFRGKRVDNDEWVYGSLVIPNTGSRDVYIFNNAGVEFTGSLAEWEVIPETVGQFTGLKDKAGKDIYEGDNIDSHIFGKGEIYYCSVNCAFKVYWKDKSKAITSHAKHSKITGNIHDNKLN
jgi:uncharacterized phage protein (TIGR01671 family)